MYTKAIVCTRYFEKKILDEFENFFFIRIEIISYKF